MTPRGLKGCREIEAVKQRLVLVKKWKKSAAEAVTLAQNQLQAARNEEEETKSILKAVEIRWEGYFWEDISGFFAA